MRLDDFRYVAATFLTCSGVTCAARSRPRKMSRQSPMATASESAVASRAELVNSSLNSFFCLARKRATSSFAMAVLPRPSTISIILACTGSSGLSARTVANTISRPGSWVGNANAETLVARPGCTSALYRRPEGSVVSRSAIASTAGKSTSGPAGT